MSQIGSIIAVTVTYGNRWPQLSKALQYLEDNSLIQKIVVVDNASSYDIQIRLAPYRKAHLISFSENTGSAGGFKSGIHHAVSFHPDSYLLLLDDDNLVEPGIIESLWATYHSTEKVFPKAVLPYRPERPYLQQLHLGNPVDQVMPIKNSFYGFHWKKIWQKSFLLHRKSKPLITEDHHLLKIPFAPYGGLFFHASCIQKTGLPNEDYFVYMDDFDFSYRFQESGGAIFLDTSIVMRELGENWQSNQKTLKWIPRVLQDEGWRNGINLRNNAYFSKNHLKDFIPVYLCNMWTFRFYLFVFAISTGRLQQWKNLEKQIKDGLAGKLGKPMASS